MKRVVLPLLVLAAAACTEPPQPRNTVQAGAIAKDDLAGQWYFRQTVIGVPYTTGFTFIGEQGENEMEKIVWDIQEDVIIARRTYEYARGTDATGPELVRPDGSFQGAPVAAFKVVSHFDVIREYNSSTGEEYDRIVENQERKWYERRFLRVDWSQNLITNFNFLADYWSTPSIQAIKQEPVPYYVTDPNDPDALRIDRPAQDQPANYLEVTQKIVASPELVTFWEDGSTWPLCWLEYATQDCNAQELRIRNAFLRAEERDYEPSVYDDHEMERFGYFTIERKSYNRQYGLTESGRVRLINRNDLWQHSLTQTQCRADADCGTLEPGVRCVTEIPRATVDTFTGVATGVCSLPYTRRNLADPNDPNSADLGPKPIVFHVNGAFPGDLKGAAKELERQYDEIFRGIAAKLTGKAPTSNVFIVCTNNPVQEGDPAACGTPGTFARIGDLRFNMLYWVDEPTSAGLLGYGPNSNDPETGEVISSTAFVYGAPIDSYAAYARDLVRLVNGEIPPDQFIDGVDVRAWVEQTGTGRRGKQLSQAEVDSMASRMDTSWIAGLPRSPRIRKGNTRDLRQLRADRVQALSQSPVLGSEPGLSSRRLAKLKGTDLEQKLVTGDVLLAKGLNPRDPRLVVDATQVRPLELFNPERIKKVHRARRRLSAHTVDLAATLDDTVIGFALAQRGKDPQAVWKTVRELVFLSTALHEVGHTLGLRHNFAGSYDAMNYPKTYWDLRTANGTKQPRPRYLDPESQAELDGVQLPNGLTAGISEFMQSSIMDYGANFNSDIQGLGKYDKAALKFGYGELLEVFTSTTDGYTLGALQATVTYGQAVPFLVDCDANDYTSSHYTKLPGLVDLEGREDVPASQVTKQIVAPQCVYPDTVDADGSKRLVVPYMFCSDEFEAASTGCEAWDRGADPWEVTQNAINVYRGHYVFDSFRRDRLGFSPDESLYRTTRSFESLRTMMQFYVLDRAYFATDIPDDGTPTNFWHSPDAYGPYTAAVTAGFDFFGEVLMTPEPGPYVRYAGADGRRAWYMDPWSINPPSFELPVGPGRFFNTEWDYDSGYYWYDQVKQVGSFWDKVIAVAELTDAETWFIGKDVAADTREFAINYYRLFPKQTMEVFSAALTDRWDLYAPYWNGSQMISRPISAPTPLPANLYPFDPQVGFTVQLWMASLGNALIPLSYDTTYADSARVWVDGSGAGITPTRPTVTFDDAATGKRYVAMSFPDGMAQETGLAARMLARAQELASQPASPERDAALRSYLELIEAQRSISSVYADPVW